MAGESHIALMGLTAEKVPDGQSIPFDELGLLVAIGVAVIVAMSSDLRVAIIGCDTSHCAAFTRILHAQDGGGLGLSARVIAAYPGSSERVDPDGSRVRRFTAELTELGVPLVDSAELAAEEADAVFILSADGSLHLDEFKRVLRRNRPVFIDKPLALSLQDAEAIVALADAHCVPLGSASALRFSRALDAAVEQAEVISGADVFCPGTLLADQGMFYYSIHGVEMLYRIMGPGCKRVRAWSMQDGDYVVGSWADGRVGWLRAKRTGNHQFGAVIHSNQEPHAVLDAAAGEVPVYVPLLEQIVPFFAGAEFAVTTTEMLEVIRFIEASHRSQHSGEEEELFV